MDHSVYQSFKDIALDDTHGMSVGYRTANTVFEEGMRDGRLLALSYNASGYLMSTNPIPCPSWMENLSNTDKGPEKLLITACPESFQLMVDGQSLHSHWKLQNVEKQEEGEVLTCRIHLRHTVRPVEVAVCTALDGTSVFRRWIEVTNTGDRPAAINELAPLSGGLQTVRNYRAYLSEGESLYRLGYIKSQRGWYEGEFCWVDLPEEIFVIAGRWRRDRYRHPMFVLQNKGTGEIFICQMEWSGGFAFEFDNQQYGPDLTSIQRDNALSFKVKLDSPQPMFVLQPGETFVSPKVDMGVVFGDLDDAVNAMHEHVRKSVLIRPQPGDFDLIETGIGPEYDMSREGTLQAIDTAADVGAEVFFIDAGWFMPPKEEGDWWRLSGNWTYDHDRYPNGLEEIREYVHSKGMKFGMWLDAERVGPGSDLARQHPEWIARQYDGRPNEAGLLDLSHPEVAAWMRAQIVRLIEDYQIDMYRLDWNATAVDALNVSRNGEYLENTYARHSNAVYGIYRSLREEYPHVIFENCAGGGGRTDLGMVSNFHHTWVTDWQLAPRSFAITNGMSLCLPPECIDRLIGGQNAYMTADIRFQLHNLMFSHFTVGGSFPLDQARHNGMLEYFTHCIRLYKEFIRPILPTCKIYHHTPVLDYPMAKGFGILEMASPDGARGVLGVFQLSNPAEKETVVRLRGADVSRTYRVYFDNTGKTVEVDGLRLAGEGLYVRLEGTLTSELVLYEAI